MPIRFRLDAEEVDSIAFAYSPLLEAVLSLHVLVEPKHHPLQHPWVRAMRRLSPDLKRGIDAFSFLYRSMFPDCFLPSPEQAFLGFEDEIARLRGLEGDVVAYEFSRMLYDHGGQEPRDPHLDDPAIRAAVLANARRHGPRCEPAAERLLVDPEAVAREVADILERYWLEAFAAEWDRVEPQLADAVARAGRRIAEEGVYSFLDGLAPRLRVDPARQEFGVDVPHEHTVELSSERRLVLVPSVYVWPHVRINCDEPWPLTLVYPAPVLAEAAHRDLPPPELLRMLRAVAHPTRLRALQLIAVRPRSTQELAPLIGITEAGLSKHLRQLAQTGLVGTRREGYYVLYSLVPQRVQAFAEALPAVIEARLG